MAGRNQQKGPCYLCGQEMAKGYMGRHLVSKHLTAEEGQPCYLLKAEDEYGKYWLFLDIPLTSSLSTLDSFLRAVWLECCGHLSAFMPPRAFDTDYSMSKKMNYFQPGAVLQYEYDFGSTTTLYITFVGKTYRPPQRTAVRVLARNAPYEFACSQCGKPAAYVDIAKWPQKFYCEQCAEAWDDGEWEMSLPVVNAPRMGVCAYEGRLDKYQYDPRSIQKTAQK